MDSKKKLSRAGIVLSVIIIMIAIYIAKVTNPFQGTFARILYSGLIGGIGGLSGAGLSHMLGFIKPSSE